MVFSHLFYRRREEKGSPISDGGDGESWGSNLPCALERKVVHHRCRMQSEHQSLERNVPPPQSHFLSTCQAAMLPPEALGQYL